MKITNVAISNFLTIGDTVEINLDNRGMVLITGDNRDDSSAISNGAGKSTIGDAICWGLYGVTARGESGDAIVNNIIGKNCCVSITLDDEGVIYEVSRYRKDKNHKNSLQVFKNTSVIGSTCLTKGTDKLTQELVDKIVGCSVEVFKSAIYAGQDSIPNLPGMTDKNLKEIVEEAAGINRLGEAYTIAREEMKHKESHAVKALADLDAVKSLKVSTLDSLSNLEDKNSNFSSVISSKIKQLLENNFDLETRHDDLKVNPHLKLVEADELKKIKEIDEELTEFFKKKDTIDVVAGQVANHLRMNQTLFKASISKVKADKEKLESIEDRIGKPCNECGKAYCEEDLESAAKIAKLALNNSKRAALELKEALAEDESANIEAIEAVKSLGNSAAAVSKNKAAIDAIRSDLKRLNDLNLEIKDIFKEQDSNNLKVVALNNEVSPYADMVDEAKALLKVLEINELDAFEKYLEATEARNLAVDAVKVFSPAGVRAHVIDTVTPHLNDRTSHYLSILSDGNISAVWNTLSKTKTGELREKFVIEVSNDKGANNFGGLSGGEKRKVRIATSLALQDLVASRASKPFALFIADEVDDALDVAGLERLMMLLEEKAREKGTVLMISHNEISDWCREQTVIIKEGGFSRIEGALAS